MQSADFGSEPITINATVGGIINGEPMKGGATAHYLPGQNLISAHMEFSHYIRSFMVVAVSSTSIFSVSCSMFSRALAGAANLASMFESQMEGTVEFRVQDLSKREPTDAHAQGVISQEFTLERVSPHEFQFSTTLNGWYNGPTGIGSKSPGYGMHLRQIKPGEIEGVYGQVVSHPDGSASYLFSRRSYRYKGTMTLPYDEVMVYRIIDLNQRVDEQNDNHFIDFLSEAYYIPAVQSMVSSLH